MARALVFVASFPLLSRTLPGITRGALALVLSVTLLPIVGGCAMSSFGSAQFRLSGLLLVCVANTAFPLRTIIYKRLRAATGAGNFTIFAGVCWRAATIVAVGNLALDVQPWPIHVPRQSIGAVYARR